MKYESAKRAIGEPSPKEFFSDPDTFDVWDSVKSRTFHELVAPFMIQEMNHPIDPWTGYPMPQRSRTLTREEFEAEKERLKHKYGPVWVEKANAIDEIEYDPHMTEAAFRYIVGRKNDKEFNDYIISKGRGGIVEAVGKFGIEAAISTLNPITLATAFIPVPGSTAIAKVAGKFGQYVYQGATGGLIGGMAEEPLRAHTKNILQEEYSWQQGLANIGMSSVGGGILGGGIYGLMKAGTKLKNITQNYKDIKSNNAILALELDQNTESVIQRYTHPQGIKENVMPLEELLRKKSELIDQQHALFPQYSQLENKLALMESNLHQEYFTSGNPAHIPHEQLSSLIPEREHLNILKQNHLRDEKFESIMQARANLDAEIHETLKKMQYDTGSYNLSPEDLHIAKSQIEDGKVIDLADPHNAQSIYEAYPENVMFKKIDDELQASFKGLNLDDLEVKSQAIENLKYSINH